MDDHLFIAQQQQLLRVFFSRIAVAINSFLHYFLYNFTLITFPDSSILLSLSLSLSPRIHKISPLLCALSLSLSHSLSLSKNSQNLSFIVFLGRNVMTCLLMSHTFEKSPDPVEPRTRARARKQPRLGNFEGLDYSDALRKFREILEADGAESDYAIFVLRHIEAEWAEADRNPRKRDEEYDHNRSNEEEVDPEYMSLLKHLDKKSCILMYEDKGLSRVIEFEEATSSEAEYDEEPRKQLTSATEQKARPSSEMPLLKNKGIQVTNDYKRDEQGRFSTKKKVPRPTTIHSPRGDSCLKKDFDQERRRTLSGTKRKDESESARTKEKEKLPRRILQNKRKCKKEDDDDIIQMDPEYFIFNKELKVDGYYFVYEPSDKERIVYETRGGGFTRVKEEPYDGSYSDVEILDSTGFYKMDKSSNRKCRDKTEFRHKVVADLERPFDKEEYKRLRRDIKQKKTKERHLELRCGRERPFGKQEMGKSYLDHYPVLKRKLDEAQGDQPKRLNLLRGFFLWIKQPEGFSPWLDKECLSIYPDGSSSATSEIKIL